MRGDAIHEKHHDLEAEGLLLNHPLPDAGSLQLAAALLWADKNPSGHPFICLDQRLREAARREGFLPLPVPA